MAKVHVTFTDLQDFQRVLRQNIDRFTEIDKRTKGTLNSYDWNDPVATKFKTDFEDGMKPILKLRDEMEGFIPWLQNKINSLMRYHGVG